MGRMRLADAGLRVVLRSKEVVEPESQGGIRSRQVVERGSKRGIRSGEVVVPRLRGAFGVGEDVGRAADGLPRAGEVMARAGSVLIWSREAVERGCDGQIWRKKVARGGHNGVRRANGGVVRGCGEEMDGGEAHPVTVSTDGPRTPGWGARALACGAPRRAQRRNERLLPSVPPARRGRGHRSAMAYFSQEGQDAPPSGTA